MIKIVLVFVVLHFFENAPSQNKLQFDTSLFNNIQNAVGKAFLFSNSKSLTDEEYNGELIKGNFTLINFWFEACEPCIAEFGALNRIYNKYKKNKRIKLISFTFESPGDALKIAKKYSLDYPIICISKEKCYELNFNNGFPTNIVTDSSGKVAYITVGGPIDTIEVDKSFANTLLKIEERIRNRL